MESTLPFCPKCGTALDPQALFCPHCGLNLQPVSTTIGRQIYMYIISFLLPPFGLIWVPKYFRSQAPHARTIAFVLIGLTVLSVLVTFWVVGGYLQGLQSQINGIDNFNTQGL